MLTNRKAIRVLDRELKHLYYMDDMYNTVNEGLIKSVEVAIKALEKQVSKTLADKWEIDNHINGECQACGEILIHESEYCSNCGQRAKWN